MSSKKNKKVAEVKKVKDLPNERWAIATNNREEPVITAKSQYYISDHGRLKKIDIKTGAEQLRNWHTAKKKKVEHVNIKMKNGQFRILAGRSVAKIWVPKKRENDAYVIHKDGNRKNNHYANLIWITREELYVHLVDSRFKSSNNPRLNHKVRNLWNERWVKLTINSSEEADSKKRQYFISDHGRVKSVSYNQKNERLLKSRKDAAGGWFNNIKGSSKSGKSFYLGKTVATHWVKGQTEERRFVIHLDADKSNNHYSNLKWVNRDELTQHQYKVGMYDNNYSKHQKLTYSQVVLLKRKLKEGKIKPKILARNFNITLTQVKRIARGENWKHVKV